MTSLRGEKINKATFRSAAFPRGALTTLGNPNIPKFDKKLKVKLKEQISTLPNRGFAESKLSKQSKNASQYEAFEEVMKLPEGKFIKQKALVNKVNMQVHMEHLKSENFEHTFKRLKEYEGFDDPKAIKLLYQYNMNYDHEYERVINEVTEDYRADMLDPERIVGKAERKRGTVRKEIEKMKRKFARMGK